MRENEVEHGQVCAIDVSETLAAAGGGVEEGTESAGVHSWCDKLFLSR